MDKVLLDGFAIGIGATLFMDLVALLLKQTLSIQPLNYSLVGRWFVHLLQGRVRHSPITASPARSYESLIGWTLHYLTGVVFVLIFLSFVGGEWLITPRLGPALAFGALTVIVPFLILQPGIGAGLAARLTPRPNIARLKSLLAHLSFGAGIWVTAICFPP